MVEVGRGVDIGRVVDVTAHRRHEIILVVHGHVNAITGVSCQIRGPQRTDECADIIGYDLQFQSISLTEQRARDEHKGKQQISKHTSRSQLLNSE